MFDALSGRLGEIFEKLRRRGSLNEEDVTEVLREVRVALLEADVALSVVKSFIDSVREQAVGTEVLRSVAPGQMVIKIVHDRLVDMLGEESPGINLAAQAPIPILMVGLQGSGKTTTTAKLAMRLQGREKKKVLMAGLDTSRPAAQDQLRVLGEQTEVQTLPVIAGQRSVDIAERAIQAGKLGGYDVVLLDTAGRLHIDAQLMGEVAEIRDRVQPVETLLVADAMTGQDAVSLAEAFNEQVGLTGIVLTRIDGDARGGAALSMRAVTGCQIKMLGVGETLDAIEDFHPDRLAGRILGMGDVVSLVEKASESIETEEAEKLARKLEKGEFDLDDLSKQLGQMRKLGGLSSVISMLPGAARMKSQMPDQNIDDRMLGHQLAIIQSMTPDERRQPKIIQASRKRRIASGSGRSVQEVNRLLKQYVTMNKMMKKMGRMGKKGLLRHGLPGQMPGLGHG
jgi:signal recognition particle subunit SRP54